MMRRFLRTLTVLATSTAMAAAITLLGAGTAHAAQTGEAHFSSPGSYQWTAPAGVDAAWAVVVGAGGGSYDQSDGTTNAGGSGDLVEGSFPLAAGQTYSIVVGGLGADAINATGSTAGGLGGYGGGGNGGGSQIATCHPGAGGGGATALFAGSGATPLLVAAGGGGARFQIAGGAGGYPAGAPGPNLSGNPNEAAGGGRPDDGGSAGWDANTGGRDGAQNGTALMGGSAGSDTCSGGGGGGGGWFGGGGGSAASSGGGGSSYVAPSVDLSTTRSAGELLDGEVDLYYGPGDAPTPVVAPALQLSAGVPESYQYSASGWPTPEIFATGTVPDGLAIGSDGSLTGTPTTPGTYFVTLNAINSSGLTSWTEEIDVAPGAPSLLSVLPATDSAVVGTTFDHDPIAHVTDQYGDPIAGAQVFFDSDGLITFARTGQLGYEVLSTDADGNADAGPVLAGTTPGASDLLVLAPDLQSDVTYTVLPAPAAPSFGPATAPEAQVGKPFDYRYATAGNPQPTVSLAKGNLPKGLSLAADGELSGTPTDSGRYRFTLKATNGAGKPAHLVQTIVVSAAATITVASTTANEGNSGLTKRKISVTLSEPSSSAVTIHWSTRDGSATAGSDYVAKSGTIRMAAGQTSATITVEIYGDTVVEPDETFFIVVDRAQNATIGTASVVQTIENDDSL